MFNDTFQEQQLTVALDVFKGLNLKTPPELLKPGEADICQNWRFNQYGHLTRRPTYAKYNATSLGANPIRYTERIYIGANKYLLAVYDTALKVGTDSAGTFADLASVTAGLRYNGETYKDYHYLVNGTDSNLKTDGSTSAVMGNTPFGASPSAVLSATVGACALDTDTYNYKHTWLYDDYQESNASAFATADAEDSVSCVILSAFEAAPYPNATGVKIYRTEGGGSIYYYLGSATAGAISSAPYYDLAADSTLDTTITAPTDNGLPPASDFIKLHKDRVFLSRKSDSDVHFSDITGVTSYPDKFPVANVIPVRKKDGDGGAGLAVDPTGYLCVFKKNSISKIFTDGAPTSWEVSEPFSKWGCWAPYTIKETPGGIIYLAKDGWRIFDGQNSRLLSNSPRLQTLVDNISLERFDDAIGHYHNHLALLSYTDRESELTYNDKLAIYDTLTDNFMIEPRKIDSFATLHGSDDWGELYFGDSVNGYVYKEEITTTGVLFNKLSQFNPGGTLSNAVVWHSEEDPYLELGGHYTLDRMHSFSTLDSVSTTSLDGLPSAYDISGTWTSPVVNVNASNWIKLYWNETLRENLTNVSVQMRTSNTEAGLSAAYGTAYTGPAGSDITAETGEEWAQFLITMSSFGLSASNSSATPRLYANSGYLMKATYGVTGVSAESTIDCDWRGGYTQLNQQFTPARLRKLMIEHTGTEGLLSCLWDLDYESVSGVFSFDLATSGNLYNKPFPITAFGRRLRLRFKYNDIGEVTVKAVKLILSPQPERY